MMLEDSDRLLGTIEQVLRAGRVGAKLRRASPRAGRLSARSCEDCLALARTPPSPAGRCADLSRIAAQRTARRGCSATKTI